MGYYIYIERILPYYKEYKEDICKSVDENISILIPY